MKIIQLKAQDRKLFADMDPFFRLEWLEMPGSFGLVAVDNDENQKLIRMGIAVCSTHTDNLILEWIYVFPEYREKGIGESFIELIFEYAKKKNLEQVSVNFCRFKNSSFDWTSNDKFFAEHLFVNEMNVYGEWISDANELSKRPFYVKDRNKDIVVKPLQSIVTDDLGEFVEKLTKNDHKRMLFPLKGNEHLLDLGLSMVAYKNDEIVGSLLVKSIHTEKQKLESVNDLELVSYNSIYPVMLRVESASAVEELMYAMVKKTISKFSKNAIVHFILRYADAVALMNRMLPDSKVESFMKFAYVADYELMKEML